MSTDVKRCHYEVLGVDRRATGDEIRQAYKKQALLLHPDKNHGKAEEAAAKFQEVQNAYSVLSDINEREWYDSHRDAILSGDNDGTCAPDELNLFDFFSTRCYSGMGDDATSFFGVYQKVFDTLIDEESGYDDRAKGWPRFGSSSTAYRDVSRFYTHWKHFNSFKTFAWKDEYKLNEIPDRQSRRAAERINNKERAAAKKEYTQLVVELANFIYTRDPRVAAEKQRVEEEEEQKAEERAKREAEGFRRRREANEKLWAEGAEIEAREQREKEERGELQDGSVLELLYEKQRALEQKKKHGWTPTPGRAEANDDEDSKFKVCESEFADSGDVVDEKVHIQCPACKKGFHSQHQWVEHVGSSKHKTKLKQLSSKGIDVDALMKGGEGEPTTEAVDPKPDDEAKDSKEAKEAPRKRKEDKRMKATHHVAPVVDQESEEDDEPPTVARNAFATLAPQRRKR